MQRLKASLVKSHVVVELQRLPRLTRAGISLRIARRFERLHRHLVTHDVVRMRIAAVLVVRRHHVRTERPHQPDQRFGGNLDRLEGEAAFGQRRQRIAFG